MSPAVQFDEPDVRRRVSATPFPDLAARTGREVHARGRAEKNHDDVGSERGAVVQHDLQDAVCAATSRVHPPTRHQMHAGILERLQVAPGSPGGRLLPLHHLLRIAEADFGTVLDQRGRELRADVAPADDDGIRSMDAGVDLRVMMSVMGHDPATSWASYVDSKSVDTHESASALA
ncbi:hypothetical protein DEO23_13590 [Brachybacterium endophyticum]|uniref:Uncharacterized protein n=1 Tax=Brachybacterium endophyticum TaxID=2182385 RepID=A0A2U2RIB8_9MICO|nr:hypothetical protein DEO23_13590 [Brachybacterium endophyticum]